MSDAARLGCDYIAGMTDHYAVAEHRRLFDETPELRLGEPEAGLRTQVSG